MRNNDFKHHYQSFAAFSSSSEGLADRLNPLHLQQQFYKKFHMSPDFIKFEDDTLNGLLCIDVMGLKCRR